MTRYRINGRSVSKKQWKSYNMKSKGSKTIEAPRIARSDFDMVSNALAVDPRDRKKANAMYRKLGVPTEHDKDGCPHFRSMRHQADYCALTGYHNEDGAVNSTYSQPDPGDFT